MHDLRRPSFGSRAVGSALALALLVAAARAQETWDDGPLIGTPFACLVSDGPGPLQEQRLYSKKAGFQTLGGRTIALASGPDFRFERIFRDRSTGTVPTDLRVDALSLGLDILWIDSDGRFNPPSRSMVGLQFAIKPEEGSLTTSGVVWREDRKADRAGTDVFDFTFGLASFSMATYRDLDGTETGLSDGTAASAGTQLTALDLPLTAWDLDSGIVGALPTRPRVFFSVPTSAVSAVPLPWWGGPAPPVAKGGAWILYSDWDSAAAPLDWSEPRPFARAGDLSLDAPGQVEDVDALAMQWDGSGSTKIVFSTQPRIGRNQLLFMVLPLDGDPTPVKTGTTNATDSAGVGSADVVAVCFYDPGLAQECNTGKLWSYVLGWQAGAPIIFPRLLESAAIRGCDSSGAAGLQCMMAGWTASGRPVPPQTAWAVHVWTVGTEAGPGPSPTWVFGPPIPRPLARTADGDPLTSFLPLPPHYVRPDPVGRCEYFWSMWLAADPSLTELAQSRWVRLRL